MAGDPAVVTALSLFVRAGASREFDWLSCNCGFWVCDWIKLVRCIDPVADFRGFQTATGFKRLVAKSGGNEAFSRAVAERAGLQQTAEPDRGDVGLISTASGASMAIYVGDGQWAAKSPTGVTIAPFDVTVAWSL